MIAFLSGAASAIFNVVKLLFSSRVFLLLLSGLLLFALLYVLRDKSSDRTIIAWQQKTIRGLKADTAARNAELRVADQQTVRIIVRRDTIIKRQRILVQSAPVPVLIDSVSKVLDSPVQLVSIERNIHGPDSLVQIRLPVPGFRRAAGLLLLAKTDSLAMAQMIDGYQKRDTAYHRLGELIQSVRPTTRWSWPWTYWKHWRQIDQLYQSVYYPISQPYTP
ncbi:hypothetical protein CLV58_12570 [Spirosoma oryzae]|uniref:Uncharacterized protein n=1 Tax=Spirosoma oryzae TaxID=1469603 RepID=A0A2T0S8Q7_9BACT|nr:hypothetical protein [Spirosoma oryzae]PRY29808.1 hypothetical protein CLV58_12570 [Spirosoma oryzae]